MTTIEMAKAARSKPGRIFTSGAAKAWWSCDSLVIETGGRVGELTLAMVLADTSCDWEERIPPKSWSGEYRVRGKRDGCEVFSGIKPHERIPEGVEQYKVKWTATEVTP